MNETQQKMLLSLMFVGSAVWYIVLAVALPEMIELYAMMVYGSAIGLYAKVALYACSLMWAAFGVLNARNTREDMLAGA